MENLDSEIAKALAGPFEERKKLFEAHGVDTSKTDFLADRDQRMQQDSIKMTALMEEQKAKVYQQYSLWPNDRPSHFEFKQWNPKLQEDSKEARTIGIKAFRLSKLLDKKSFNVLFNGLPGVGKTSLALALMHEAKVKHLSTMFVSTTVLQDLYTQRYEDRMVDEQLRNVLRAMKEVDFLLLDDLGTEGGSIGRIKQGYSVRIDLQRDLYSIANARWNEAKNEPKGHTVITTNNLDKELKSMYDPKTISRLIPQDKEYRIGFNNMKDVRGIKA